MRSPDSDDKIWQKAFDSSDAENALSLEEAARLNSQIHIASAGEKPAEPNVVLLSSCQMSFPANLNRRLILRRKLQPKSSFAARTSHQIETNSAGVLIQCQAVCDYAQTQPGPLPYYLGLELPEGNNAKKGTPAALWTSPPFYRNGEVYYLRVNSRFQLSLPTLRSGERAAKVSPQRTTHQQPHISYSQLRRSSWNTLVPLTTGFSHGAAVRLLTTASMTGGQTPFPSSRMRSRRVPTGRANASSKPIARLSSGTCNMRIFGIDPS